jgi:hypothetical protein
MRAVGIKRLVREANKENFTLGKHCGLVLYKCLFSCQYVCKHNANLMILKIISNVLEFIFERKYDQNEKYLQVLSN